MSSTTSALWGVKCKIGDREWWYGGASPALGTEAEARDKADRRNDSDQEGIAYRAERYTNEEGHAPTTR